MPAKLKPESQKLIREAAGFAYNICKEDFKGTAVAKIEAAFTELFVKVNAIEDVPAFTAPPAS
jgi:hypothetical protein